jgi:hypothetical protein
VLKHIVGLDQALEKISNDEEEVGRQRATLAQPTEAPDPLARDAVEEDGHMWGTMLLVVKYYWQITSGSSMDTFMGNHNHTSRVGGRDVDEAMTEWVSVELGLHVGLPCKGKTAKNILLRNDESM